MTPVYDAAVVGSSGFLGSAIATGLERRGATVARFTLESPLLSSGVFDERARGIRTLVWAAAHTNPILAAERADLVAAERDEFAGTLGALAALSRPPRVLFLSSGGTVYGPPERAPFSELADPHPLNAYGALKRAMEEDLENSGLEAVSVRVSNAYGPGQVPAPGQGVIAHWLSAALKREPITIYGDRVSTRDYVFIDDVVEAVVRIHASTDALPAILNVGSGVASTLTEVLAAVESAVGADRLEIREEPRRGSDTTHTWLDVTRARDELGWSAEVRLVEGVKRAWTWVQTR